MLFEYSSLPLLFRKVYNFKVFYKGRIQEVAIYKIEANEN